MIDEISFCTATASSDNNDFLRYKWSCFRWGKWNTMDKVADDIVLDFFNFTDVPLLSQG